MAQLKIDIGAKLVDGMDVKFKSPCDCTEVTGLLVAYINEKGAAAEKSFTFRDCHNNNLAGVGNMFSAGAYVTAVLDTVRGYAFIQNADTNAYLEAKKAPALKTPRKIGSASFDGSKDISLSEIGAAAASHTHTPASIGAAELDANGKVAAAQSSANIVQITESTTLGPNHCGQFLQVNSSNAVTINVTNDSDIPVGAEVEILRYGAGAVTIAAASNIGVRGIGSSSTGEKYKITDRYGCAVLKRVGTVTWILSGAVAKS